MPISRKRKTNTNSTLADTVAYETIKRDKTSDLILLYDEANVLLFERPASKVPLKRV